MSILKKTMTSVGIIVLIILVWSVLRDVVGFVPGNPLHELSRQMNARSGAALIEWCNGADAGKLTEETTLLQLLVLYPLAVLVVIPVAARIGLTRLQMSLTSTFALALLVSMLAVATYMASTLTEMFGGKHDDGSHFSIITAFGALILTNVLIRVLYRPKSRNPLEHRPAEQSDGFLPDRRIQ